MSTVASKTMMKALVFENHKDTPTIANDIPRPEPSTNQVQVKVEYAALDHGFDGVLHNTWVGMFIHKQTKPLLLGWHYAGTVTDIGDKTINSTSFKVGDAVFGHLEHSPHTTAGTLAEYITVPVAECAHRPASVDAPTAAAASVEASTALQALRDYGKLKSDNSNSTSDEKKQPTVLVVGAGGGVGSAAVQMARAMGAHVTAVCSARDVTRVREYGANVILSRGDHTDPLLAPNTVYDVIFDTPMVLSVAKALRRLKPKGQYVAAMPSWSLLWGFLASIFSSKGVHMVEVKPHQADLMMIADWMAQGQLKIPIDSTFKIKDITDAIHRQRQHKSGRVVIQVHNGWN
eukprot:scaffold34938_cov261-Amphora_coffeaeformis.AAC.3